MLLKKIKKIFTQTDFILIIITLALSVYGTVMVSSATYTSESTSYFSRDAKVMILAFMLGLAAVITGAIAKSKAKAVGMKNGKATVGFICGLIAVILIAVVGIIVTILFALVSRLGQITGATNSKLLKRSNTPPCPGINLP